MFYFFFFKQKTAYEMRISDWSSDVCSSDLEQHELLGSACRLIVAQREELNELRLEHAREIHGMVCGWLNNLETTEVDVRHDLVQLEADLGQQKNGRASCRDRVCQREERGGRRIIEKKKRNTKQSKKE